MHACPDYASIAILLLKSIEHNAGLIGKISSKHALVLGGIPVFLVR